MAVTIYHNPRCGTSRTVLGMIRACGIEPVVVDYLKAPLSRDALQALFGATGQPIRTLLRRSDALYATLNLDDPALSDEDLLDAVVANPILMNRPIVSSERGTALCRPAESVAALLPPATLPKTYTKENGDVINLTAGGSTP